MKHTFMMLLLILLINYLICYYLSQYIYATSRRIDNNKVLLKFIHYPYLKPLRIITSIVMLFLYKKFTYSIEFWVGVFLLYIVTIISFIDYNYYIIPESGRREKLPRRFNKAVAEEILSQWLREQTAEWLLPDQETELISYEHFNTVHGYYDTGDIYSLRMQLKPGILHKVQGKEVDF